MMSTTVSPTNVPPTTDQSSNPELSADRSALRGGGEIPTEASVRTVPPNTEGEPVGSVLLPPIPSKLSQLERDGGYLSITEWKLNYADLVADTTPLYGIEQQMLCRVEVSVVTPFVVPDLVPEMTLELPGSITVMDSKWNHPGELGLYMTECSCEVTGTGGLIVKHNLKTATAGSMIVRVYGYRN